MGGNEDNSSDIDGGGHRQQSTKRASRMNVGGSDGDGSLNSNSNVNSKGDRDNIAR